MKRWTRNSGGGTHNSTHKRPGKPAPQSVFVSEVSPRKLSVQAQISDTYASYVLRGLRTPTLDLAARIAEVLGVTLDELYRRIKRARAQQPERAA